MTCVLLTMCYAQTPTEIKPKGVYKEVEVEKHNNAITILLGKNGKLKDQQINNILKSPNDYNPPVLYALSRQLFNSGRKDTACFWFYVAQLRARFDANLCMDNSAKQAVSVLNQEYGHDINRYAFQDINRLEAIVIRVVEFVRTNKENYDHRWINLHGMDAVVMGIGEEVEQKALSQPKEKWNDIKQKTVDDYYNGFIKNVMGMKK